MRQYCTLFDRNYLAKGTSLIRSVEKHSSAPFQIHVLALDDETARLLKVFDNKSVVIYTLADVMTPELEVAKGNRTHQEFCWTLASYFTNWLVEQQKPQTEMTYLDSDLFFFADPEIAHADMQGKQVGIVPHRLIPSKKYLEVNGIFNVGWVSFKLLGTKSTGRKLLKTWRDQCLDWCYNRAEPTRYADQKYLDTWPNYGGCCIHVVKHIGIGAAPWNLAQYAVEEKDGKLCVDQQPVVFYHYHEFAELPNDEFRLTYYHLRPNDIALVYDPYLKAYREARELIALAEKGSNA